MAPLHARPRVSAVAQAPIEVSEYSIGTFFSSSTADIYFLLSYTPMQIHAQNKQFAASKVVSSADESASSSELEDMEFGEGDGEGEAYDPAKPNDYMEYCQVGTNK